MTLLRKPISAFLAIVLFVMSAAVPTFALNGNRDELTDEELSINGYTPMTTQQFITLCDDLNDAIESLLGIRLIPEEKLAVSITGHMSDMFDDLKEVSGGVLDCHLIAQSLPELAGSAEKIKSLFKIDMTELEPVLRAKSQELFAEGNALIATVVFIVRIYLKSIVSAELYSVQNAEDPEIYDIYIGLEYLDGSEEDAFIGLQYNSRENTLDNIDETGILGFGFALDTENYVLTTVVKSWQRYMGFTLAYDIFCYATSFLDYETVRIKFVYDNKEWMIQLWKGGRYLIIPGGEMGIYTREIGAPGTFYNCASDDELMTMTMEIYHHDDLLLSRGPMKHWWLTGFKFGPKTFLPEDLTMKGTIEFFSVEMADLFVESAAATGEVETVQNGVNVALVW